MIDQDPRSAHPELQDYVLLLQLSSDSDNGIGVFWDNYSAGQFFIHPDDLKNKDFSKVMYYWSSTKQ